MKAEKMVTRTFVTSIIEVLGVDENQPDVTVTKELEVEGEVSKEKAMKVVKERFEDTTFHPSFIRCVEYEEKILGVPVSYFLTNGTPVERPASQKKAEN